MGKRLHRLLLLVGLLLGSASAVAQPNYQGLWWAAPAGSESGWGINLSHQDDTIFAAWFGYDTAGKPWWLVAALTKTADGTYNGDVATGTGPPFGAATFDPGLVKGAVVGTMTLTFSGPDDGSLTYAVNGVTRTNAITRQLFGPKPVCAWGQLADLTQARNYTDLWWNPNESGWGIGLSHQGDVVFAAWFTYDATGAPWWLVAALTKTADATFTGDVVTGTGPPFGAATFDPGLVKATVVGTATLTLADGNHASFAYTVNGESRTKAITRQVFAPPGTVCSPAAPTPAMVTMSFRVSVPSNTPAGDQLLIRTFFGGEKREEFMLTAVPGSPGVFQTSALLPEGTVMQYMYLRNLDQGRAETYPLLAKQPTVHWREALVRGGATVVDTIAQWHDLQPLPATTGTLRGLVTDTSGKPLMGIRVSAGPHQTITRWDGSYRVLAAPAGPTEITFRADNGEFAPTRMSATVATSGVTVANAVMTASRMAAVTFTVTVPPETPAGATPRLFGETHGLGMLEMHGSTEIEGTRFLELAPIGPRKWSVTVRVGIGTCVNYAYTLGSMSLNAERDASGARVRRSLCVTDDVNADDVVTAWKTPTQVPVHFSVSAPTAERIYLITNAWYVVTRLTMWPSGSNQASYVIYVEPDITVRYRYEREGGPELIEPDQEPPLMRSIAVGTAGAQANDTITAWRHQMRETAQTTVQTAITGPVVPRTTGVFQTGVEYMDFWRPSWRTQVRPSIARLKDKNVRWVQIAGVWGMPSTDPPLMELGWNGFPTGDLVYHIREAKAQGLHVVLKSLPFEVDSQGMDALARGHDRGWYDQYFDEIKAVFMYHALIAQQEGVDLLILTNRLFYEYGDQPESGPAMRAYINGKWKEIVAAIRAAAPSVKLAPEGVSGYPEFDWYANLDYLGDKWWWALTKSDNATVAEMHAAALDRLRTHYLPIVTRFQKPFIFTEVAYHSANSTAKGTDGYNVSSPEINPFLPAVAVPSSDYDEQARAYQAVLLAFAATPWVQGAYSFGYWYNDLDAKDYSIRSKTAEEITSQIYRQLNGM